MQVATNAWRRRRIPLSNGVDDLAEVLGVTHELQSKTVGSRRGRVWRRLDHLRPVVSIEERGDRHDTLPIGFLAHPLALRRDERIACAARRVEVALEPK